mgnify:CR=1 FL=1
MGRKIGFGFLALFMGSSAMVSLMVSLQSTGDDGVMLFSGVLMALVWGSVAFLSALIVLGKYDPSNIRWGRGVLAFICGNLAAFGIGSVFAPGGTQNLVIGIIFGAITLLAAKGSVRIKAVRIKAAPKKAVLKKQPVASQSNKKTTVAPAGLSYIDKMEGHEFEQFTAALLRKLGYERVEVTPGSGDQGVDVIAVKDGKRYAIQCKRYSQKLGNKPVQEVFAGKTIYGCSIAVVLTNNYFTEGAKEAARATGVELWDRDTLRRMMDYANFKALV